MKELIQLQRKVYPDLLKVMQKRFTILHTISLYGPIGRRGIVSQTNMPERYIRTEVSFLQNQQFIHVST